MVKVHTHALCCTLIAMWLHGFVIDNTTRMLYFPHTSMLFPGSQETTKQHSIHSNVTASHHQKRKYPNVGRVVLYQVYVPLHVPPL